MQHLYKLLTLLLLSNLAAFGQTAPATNYMNLGGANVNVGVGFTNASGVYPRYPLSFPNVVGDKISLWNTNPASLTAPHYGLGVQGFRFQLFAPTTSDNIVFGIGNSANFTENVRFTGDGNVGIGTTSPTLAGLVVDRRIGATNALFGSNTSGVAIETNFPGVGLNTYYGNGRKAIAPGFVGGLSLDPTNGNLTFYGSSVSATTANAPINTANRMTILANGNVGIGMSPARKLDVNGNTRIVGDGSAPSLDVTGGVKLLTGDQGAGNVLTSDASGNASWQKAGYGAVSFETTNGDIISGYSYYDLDNSNAAIMQMNPNLDDDQRINTNTYTVGKNGYYAVHGSVTASLDASLNGFYRLNYIISIYKNGTRINSSSGGQYNQYISNGSTIRNDYPAILDHVLKCNAGDVITLQLRGSGSPTDGNRPFDLKKVVVNYGYFTITKL